MPSRMHSKQRGSFSGKPTDEPPRVSATRVPTIRFDATLYTIDRWTILRLPEKATGKLPSRGQVAVQGTISAGDRRPSRSRHAKTGRSRTCQKTLRQLWRLPLRRSKTYGRRSRRWRAGNGFAGSKQPRTLIPGRRFPLLIFEVLAGSPTRPLAAVHVVHNSGANRSRYAPSPPPPSPSPSPIGPGMKALLALFEAPHTSAGNEPWAQSTLGLPFPAGAR